MKLWICLAICALTSFTNFATASDKTDIDTSPRVFSSAQGKYWVRITTKREMRDVNHWTTTMVLYHADDNAAEEKVVSRTTLTTFPRQVLVSDFGEIVTLGHCAEVSVKPIITVYGPDGKPRGETEFHEFTSAIPAGAQRAEAFENLSTAKGATFDYYRTPHILAIPLGGGRTARLSMVSGRPVE